MTTSGTGSRTGAAMDQPYIWKLAVDCVTDAIGAARAQARAEAREKMGE